ncbi:Uma2 family endonuclease [Thermoleptolyngbya sp.]
MLESPRADLIDYPETDGQPMTESDATRAYLIYCISALRLFFQSRPQVYVSGNLFIYYEEGKPQKSISPDVFVVFGVSKRERRSYKTWQEGGKLPSFVLEITSLTTQKQDEEAKPKLYASLGIQEYFQYDPTGDYLKPQLKGQRLVNGQYEPIAPETLADGTLSLHSQTLGLDLRLLPPHAQIASLTPTARELRLFDPQSGAQLLTYEEAEQARLNAEQKIADLQTQSAEAQAQREAAERQLAALQEKLRSRGIDPDAL